MFRPPPLPSSQTVPSGWRRRRNGIDPVVANDEDLNLPLRISNAQSLINGGFTFFRLLHRTPPSVPNPAFAETEARVQTTTEKTVYAALVRETPHSVLHIKKLMKWWFQRG